MACQSETAFTKIFRKVEEDVNTVKAACTKNKLLSAFIDFTITDESCSFTFKQGLVKKRYQLHYTDDYPVNGALTTTDLSRAHRETSETQHVQMSFVELFNITAQRLGVSVVVETSSAEFDQKSILSDDNDEMDVEPVDDDDSFDSGHNFEVFFDRNRTSSTMSAVSADVDELNMCAGQEIAIVSVLPELDDVIIDMHLQVNMNCDEEMLSIWKIDKTEPIRLRLIMHESLYREGPVPKVDVYQRFNESNAIINQLRMIGEAYISKNWTRKGANYYEKNQNRQTHTPLSCKDSGLLLQIYNYISQRFLTLPNFCVICDTPHMTKSVFNMQKPQACERELCIFAFQTLGVMNNVMPEAIASPDIADILVKFAIAASVCARRELVFSPYPSVVNPAKTDALAFTPKSPDFKKLEKVLSSIPERISAFNTVITLKKEMDSTDILAYPLLQWLLSSNQSHIVKLPKDKQLDCLLTTNQYYLRCSNPKQEEIFLEAKHKHGSCFAFHGSPIFNWHGILRHGLLVASGTNMQINGAAHGKGIYLSPQFNFSAKYATTPKSPIFPILSSDSKVTKVPGACKMVCVALCEVIKSDLVKVTGQPIWRTTRAEYVCTRFFFIFDHLRDVEKLEVIDSENHKIISQIEKAMSFSV